MSGLDWLWLGCLSVALFQGFWRGLTQELVMLAGWICVLLFSAPLARSLAPELPMAVEATVAKQAVAFVLSALLILIVARLLAWMLRKVVALVGLGWLDHVLGAGLGLLRGVLILLLLVWVIQQTPLHEADFWRASHGVTIAARGLSFLETVLPSEFGKFIASCAESLVSLVSPQSIN